MHLEIAGCHVLLDAGPGTLAKLSRFGVAAFNLHSLWLTHAHPDHSLDLASILFAMRVPHPARKAPFLVYGPKGIKKLYRGLNSAFRGWLSLRTCKLMLREISAQTVRAGKFTVRAERMSHSTPALGFRVEANGKSVAYSGDTDMCPGIIRLGRGADLLILECSMPDERKVPGHLTPSECGRIAAAAGCRKLALTHFFPDVFDGYDIRARVRRFYRGPVVLAKDFLTLKV
jgi:ribonuclease BN (tRNA processing enzyme)